MSKVTFSSLACLFLALAYAGTAGAASTTTTIDIIAGMDVVAECANWEGTWTFTFSGDKTEQIHITDICSKPTVSTATPDCMPGGSVKNSWLCVAHGKKLSDNSTVQIRQINMDKSVYGYYESTDAAILASGADTPYDKISTASYITAKCSFTADAASLGLQSGQKADCTPPTTSTTTTTVAGPCPAQKVLGENSQDIESLRAFRDGSLAGSAMGRKLAQIYYNNADAINAVLDRSPALRSFAGKAFRAAAQLVK